MPETKKHAKARAKILGFSQSSVIKSDSGYFIVPKGITTSAGKKAYADCRAKGKDKVTCAKTAHSVNKKAKK